MSDLSLLMPEARTVEVRGVGSVEIMPIRVRQIPGFTKAILPLLPYAQAGDFISLTMHHMDAAVAVATIGSGLTHDMVHDLYPDDLARLLSAVFEVNLDFFGRCILPAGQEMATKVSESLGQIRSSDLPESEAPLTKH